MNEKKRELIWKILADYHDKLSQLDLRALSDIHLGLLESKEHTLGIFNGVPEDLTTTFGEKIPEEREVVKQAEQPSLEYVLDVAKRLKEFKRKDLEALCGVKFSIYRWERVKAAIFKAGGRKEGERIKTKYFLDKWGV